MMRTVVCRSPNDMAGGGVPWIVSDPLKSSGISNTLSSVMLMLKHCLGLVGVREKKSKKFTKSSSTEGRW